MQLFYWGEIKNDYPLLSQIRRTSIYDLIVTEINAHSLHTRYAQQKNGKVFQYLNCEAIPSGTPRYQHYVDSHPTYFLYDDADQAGNKMVEKDYSTNYLLDLDVAACRADRIEQINQIVANGNLKGIALDVICSWMYENYYASVDDTGTAETPINHATGIAYTDAEWLNMFTTFLIELIDQADYEIFMNGIGWLNGDQYDNTTGGQASGINALCDYVMMEGAFRGLSDAVDTWRTEANIVKDLAMIIDLGDKACVQANLLVDCSAAAATALQIFNYCTALYLLACSSNSHYCFMTTSNPNTPAVTTKLAFDWNGRAYDLFSLIGTPTSTYAKAALTGGDNTYDRDFTYGKVLVNPTANDDAAVTLGATYYQLDGTAVTEPAMAAHTGLVLFETDPTA